MREGGWFGWWELGPGACRHVCDPQWYTDPRLWKILVGRGRGKALCMEAVSLSRMQLSVRETLSRSLHAGGNSESTGEVCIQEISRRNYGGKHLRMLCW